MTVRNKYHCDRRSLSLLHLFFMTSGNGRRILRFSDLPYAD